MTGAPGERESGSRGGAQARPDGSLGEVPPWQEQESDLEQVRLRDHCQGQNFPPEQAAVASPGVRVSGGRRTAGRHSRMTPPLSSVSRERRTWERDGGRWRCRDAVNTHLGPVVLNKKFIANIEIDSLHTGISKVRKTISCHSVLKQENWRERQMEGGEINVVNPPKEEKEGAQGPPGGAKFRTQRGVTGSESRAPSPAPQGSNQVPGRHAPWGLAAPEEGAGERMREAGRGGHRCLDLHPSPVLDWQKRGGEGGHPYGHLYSPCCSAGASGIWVGGWSTEASEVGKRLFLRGGCRSRDSSMGPGGRSPLSWGRGDPREQALSGRANIKGVRSPY